MLKKKRLEEVLSITQVRISSCHSQRNAGQHERQQPLLCLPEEDFNVFINMIALKTSSQHLRGRMSVERLTICNQSKRTSRI